MVCIGIIEWMLVEWNDDICALREHNLHKT